ncbi:MAG: hypothetical protein ACFCD0_25680 [Gemmataceae bacterium]
MEFRWAAAIALWTLLSGPIFYSPSGLPESATGSDQANVGEQTQPIKIEVTPRAPFPEGTKR